MAITVATVFLPALFIAMMFLALTQSFSIAVVILISLIIVQTILSKKYDIFSWDEYSDLSFKSGECSKEEIRSKALNIMFNLSRLAALFFFMWLIVINYKYTNYFGNLGYAISISLTFILALIYILKRGRYSYENLRGILTLITTVAIGIFTYLYFGTQLIWFAGLFQMILCFVFLAGFDIEKKFKLEDYSFGSVTLAVLILTSIVSTIIQFWGNICDLMIRFWSHVVTISLYQLIPGLDMYLMVLETLGFGLVIYLIISYAKRREARKVAYAKLLQEEAEKKERKEKEATEREEKKKAEENRISEIKAGLKTIIEQAQTGTIINNQLAYLAFNRNYLESELPIKSLANISLKDAFQISTLKQHITWHHDLEDVLIFINSLYAKSYKDEELEQLIKLLRNLYTFLLSYHDYLGYDKFYHVVEEATKSIPTKHYRY